MSTTRMSILRVCPGRARARGRIRRRKALRAWLVPVIALVWMASVSEGLAQQRQQPRYVRDVKRRSPSGFQRELTVLRLAKNVPGFPSLVSSAGLGTIVTERLDAFPLTRWRNRTPRAAAQVVLWLLNPLGYLHASGYLHGDLRPGRVLVSSQYWSVLTLVDFDHALPTDAQGVATEPHEVAGPDDLFAAPERLTAELRLDESSDVYSAAMILAVLTYPLSVSVVRSAAASGVGSEAPGLGRIVGDALQPERRQRTRSARELEARLREWMETGEAARWQNLW